MIGKSPYLKSPYQKLTIKDKVQCGDTIHIDDTIYSFINNNEIQTVGTICNNIDLQKQRQNIIDAINGEDGINKPHPLVKARSIYKYIIKIEFIWEK